MFRSKKEIRINLADLTDRAAMLLRCVREQGHWTGYDPDPERNVSLVLFDYGDTAGTHIFRVKARSLITFSERCRQFGCMGLDDGDIQVIDGVPNYLDIARDIATPTDAYIARHVETFGGDIRQEVYWSIFDAAPATFSRITMDLASGPTALHELAIEFGQWCYDGEWEPAPPPLVPAQVVQFPQIIYLSASEVEYLKFISPVGELRDGIMVALDTHRRVSNLPVLPRGLL